MELDVCVEDDCLSLSIDKPFQADIDSLTGEIERFAVSRNASLNGIDIRGLIPKMIRGVAGCEGGCPANAKAFVREGFGNFSLDYIEGGILAAQVRTEDSKTLQLKMFPEF
jgi:hypothetical protein